MAYFQTQPSNKLDKYTPDTNVDFLVADMGKSLLRNNFMLCGKLYCEKSAGSPVTLTDDIKYDNETGIHSFFDQFITSFEEVTVENIQEYSRWVKMSRECENGFQELWSKSSNTMELCCDNEEQAKAILVGDNSRGIPFCFRPNICINNCTSDLPYSKTGQLKLTLKLKSASQALHGTGMTGTVSYYIKDLTLWYQARNELPGDKSQPIQMVVKNFISQQLTSQQSSVIVKTTIPTMSLSMSFLYTNNISDITKNYLKTDKVPNVERVEFSVSDNVSSLVNYPLVHPQEIQKAYLDSMNSDGKALIGFKKNDSNYGIGMNYGSVAPNTKLGINMQSDINSLNPMTAFLYFKGVVAM